MATRKPAPRRRKHAEPVKPGPGVHDMEAIYNQSAPPVDVESRLERLELAMGFAQANIFRLAGTLEALADHVLSRDGQPRDVKTEAAKPAKPEIVMAVGGPRKRS